MTAGVCPSQAVNLPHSHLPMPCQHLDSVRGIGKIQESSLPLPSCCQCTKVVNSPEVMQRQSEGPERGSKLAKVTQRARSKARSDSLLSLSSSTSSVLSFVISKVLGDRRRLQCTEGLLCARHCTKPVISTSGRPRETR